ncbi:MAG: ABC transporter ATP-binding protein [Anaerolineae bacterium]|nr:ABC transporter ATP-binding protein [Anaerolineae bacterium]
MSPFFEIKNLNVAFQTFEGIKQVLEIEHLAVNKGETFGLVGESGAGKTVLALTMLNLLPKPPAIINSGEIWFDGQDLLKKNPKELQEHYRGKRISMIFQDPMSTLNPVFTVGDQLGRVLHRHKGLRGKELERQCIETLEMVKMPDASSSLRKYPHELSGGQRQRIIIAIALSCGAEFLIADEPTRNLDVTIQAGILKLINELQRDLGISVLFIANNMGLVNVICKNIGILYRGKIVEMGSSREIVQDHKHPYTNALISAIPRDKSEKLKFATSLMRPESADGCPYYARCPLAVDACNLSKPDYRKVSENHLAACIFAGGGAQ